MTKTLEFLKETQQRLLTMIQVMGSVRTVENFPRRFMKATEELGELGEAFNSVTSPNNPKQKTWADVREEAVDLAIMAIDLAFTPLPPDREEYHVYGLDYEVALSENVLATFARKLDKWEAQVKSGEIIT